MRQWINAASNRLDESYANAGTTLSLSYPGAIGDEVPVTILDVKKDIENWADHYGYTGEVKKWFATQVFNWAKRRDPIELANHGYAEKMDEYLEGVVGDWAYGSTREVLPDPAIFGMPPITKDSEYYHSLADYLREQLPEWAKTSYVLFPYNFEAYTESTAEDDYNPDGPNDELIKNWYEIADYLSAMVAAGRKIDRVSIPQAQISAYQWHEAMERQEAETAEPDEEGKDIGTVMDFKDGYRMVRILSTKGLDRESAKMAHCIGKGSYDNDLLTGNAKFYSLRNAKNDALATLEVRGNEVLQAKGVKNNAVASEVHSHVAKFIIGAGLQMRRDHDKIGIKPI